MHHKSLVGSIFCSALSTVLSCNSLVDEAHRIQTVYNEKYTPVPVVISTAPADNSVAPYTQTTVAVVFSTPIDPTTISAQSAFGPCTGSFQISYDGFDDCIGGTLDTSQNPTIIFTPTYLPKTIQLFIQITSDVESAVGLPAQPYTSPNGFMLGSICGSNCFFSYSTPLMENTGTTTHIFPIQSGTNTGKFIAYSSSSATTTLIDPVAVTSSVGPSLAPCFTPGDGAYDFYIASGPLAGKQFLVKGGGSTATCVYDPAANAFTNLLPPPLPLPSGPGGLPILLTSGPSAGDTLLVAGGLTTNSMQYKVSTGTIANISGTSPLPNPVNSGAYFQRVVAAGPMTGQAIVFLGGGLPATALLNEMGPNPAFSNCWSLSGALGAGMLSFEALTGAQAGKIITLQGGGSLNANIASATSCAGLSLSGPFVSSGPVAGALLLRQTGTSTYNAPVLLFGGSSNTTQYDPVAGNFPAVSAIPPSTGPIDAGSTQIFMGASSSGSFFIANGGSTASTSVFNPRNLTFSGSRLPTNIPQSGAHYFHISHGVHSGKTMIIGGASSQETALFNPLTFQIQRGPQLTVNATNIGFDIRLTAGAHSGKNLELNLVGGAINAYDPATGNFSDYASLTPALPAFPALAAGASAFAVLQVVNDTRIVVIPGAGGPTASLWDQSTNPMTPLAIPCMPNVTAMHLRYQQPSTGYYRELVYCSGNTLAWFDHSTVTFPGTLTLPAATSATIKGFVIPSGPNTGQVLIMHGSPLATSSIIDAQTNTVSVGPALGACAPSTGAQLAKILSGPNAGQMLLIVGGSSTTTCLYDPSAGATGTFTVNTPVSSTPSPGYQVGGGSVAFPAAGGRYRGSTIVLTGTGSNVWSVYTP